MDPFSFYYSILKQYINPSFIPTLAKLWENPKRKFHNLDHLKDVLAFIEKNKNKILTYDRYVAIVLAAFFHDAWYEPIEKHNEDKSIDLLKRNYQYVIKTKESKQYFDPYLEPVWIDKLKNIFKLKKIFKLKNKDKEKLMYNDPAILHEANRLIEVTKHRIIPMEKLARLFWMADNEILTKDFEVLKTYETKIRQEYLRIPEIIYRTERIKFLKTNIGLFNKNADENLLKLIQYCEDIYKK